MVLIIGENLYGQQADDVDKAFAISSLLTLGAGKLAPVQDVADGFKKINIISSVGSFSKSLKQEYETKY
ncbi:MAG: hypothetical protein IJP76_04505 [Paludibacteraceae bacterium]|nr:hypothetical protein [Paludibacteraceae bacterium]